MDGAGGVGGDAGNGVGGVGGVGDSSDAGGIGGVADAIGDAIGDVADAIGDAVGAAVGAALGNEALGDAIGQAVSNAVESAIGMAIGAALGGPMGLGMAAFGGFASDTLGDVVDSVTQEVGNHFGLDQAVIDGMQAAANLAVGDKLGAMANVSEMMDELGVAQAIGNPAAFSQMERDLSGFLSL
jgi:hypothetical protein